MAKKKDIETLSEEQKAKQEENKQQKQEVEQLNPAVVVADGVKPAPAPATESEPAPAPEPTQVAESTAAQQMSLGQQMLEKDRAASLKPETIPAPPAPLDTTTVDPYVAAAATAARNEQKSFTDYVLGLRQDLNKAQAEGDQEVKNDLAAARWTGLTELASSIANMVGVGQGNAVSQQYTPQSMNWMQKADRDMKAQRSRIDNLRQRQRETELKMNQIKANGELALSKARMEAEQQKWLNAYRKAQVEYENARTEAARQKAADDARKAEVEIQAIQALANQRDASARSNLIRAGATQKNADSRASSVENQNANRDSRTGSQNMVDLSRAGLNWSKASGQPVQPPVGWSVGTPVQAQAPSNNSQPKKKDTTGLGAYK